MQFPACINLSLTLSGGKGFNAVLMVFFVLFLFLLLFFQKNVWFVLFKTRGVGYIYSVMQKKILFYTNESFAWLVQRLTSGPYLQYLSFCLDLSLHTTIHRMIVNTNTSITMSITVPKDIMVMFFSSKPMFKTWLCYLFFLS